MVLLFSNGYYYFYGQLLGMATAPLPNGQGLVA